MHPKGTSYAMHRLTTITTWLAFISLGVYLTARHLFPPPSTAGGGASTKHADPPAPSPSCRRSPDGAKIRIACVGDSITRGDASHEPGHGGGGGGRKHGDKLAGRGNYPATLQSLLGPKYDVRNFGRGGATACNASDNPYIATDHFAEAREFGPDLVVAMLGTNDAKSQFWEDGGPPGCGGGGAFLSGMRQILSGLNVESESSPRRRDPAVLLVPPPPVLRDKFNITAEYLPPIRDAVRSMGKVGAMCDGLNGYIIAPDLPIPSRESLFMRDGIHLNRDGSSRLACAVFNELLEQCRKGWVDCLGGEQVEWSDARGRCKKILNKVH